MTDRELMQQALEALEDARGELAAYHEDVQGEDYNNPALNDTITALSERLKQPEQEPEHDYRTRYDRGCYKCGSHYCPAACPEPTHLVPQQPDTKVNSETIPEQISEPQHTKKYVTEQEPVAWGMRDMNGSIYDCISTAEHQRAEGSYNVPLYTTPQPDTKANFGAIPEQISEPVAWRYRGNLHEFDPSDWAEGPVTPLYTTPPRREWQGLTLEEFDEIHDRSDTMHEAMVDVVKKLREKNA